jgi:hypothetical protein
MDTTRIWYEFRLGTIDNRYLFVLFQIDERCTFMRSLPVRTTVDEEGRLRECCSNFILKFILRAARLLDKNCDTAKGGIRYVMQYVDRGYNIMSRDFGDFCRLLSIVLRTRSLCKSYGMTCVRFYVAQHGMRLESKIVA